MEEGERSRGIEKRFGQSVPPLSIYIQKVLQRYPKEEILKELVQNAEDAGAKELTLTLDCRQFPSAKLYHPLLKNDATAPALHVHNDAPFTKADWDNIQKTERSYKASEWEQIGRFGIGFNAVYHLTDHPWIGSGDLIGVFDPQESGIFQDPVSGRPSAGLRWHVHLHRAEIHDSYPDQFRPFQHAFSANGIPGTEFRFPLRREKSVLSDTLWTPEQVEKELFTAFLEDAHHLLLFLSSLSTIRIRRWDHNHVEPRTLYCLRAKRSNPVSKTRESSFLVVEMEEEDRRSGKLVEKKHVFAVQHRIQQGGEVGSLSQALQTVAWVAVAADLARTPPLDAGRTFCFLPLPPSESHNHTRLPIHVHGAFALTDSRRTLAQQHHSDTRSVWNRLLCEELLPQAYADLIGALQAPAPSAQEALRGHEGRLPNRLYPDLSGLPTHWKPTAQRLYQLQRNVLWSEVNGKYVPFDQAYFLPWDKAGSGDELIRFAKLADIALVPDPPYLADAISIAKGVVPATLLSPAQVSRVLSSRPALLGLRGPVPAELRGFLLRYLLQETELLLNLHLLPTAAGTFIAFTPAPVPIEETVFLVEEDALRGLLTKRLASRLLAPKWNSHLLPLAQSGTTQLVAFQPSQHMPHLLTSFFDGLSNDSALQLLPQVWEYLIANVATLDICEDLRLLPVASGSGKAKLGLLSSTHRLLHLSGEDCEHMDWLSQRLSVQTLATNFEPKHPDLGRFLWRSCFPQELVAALLHAHRSQALLLSAPSEAFSSEPSAPAAWLRRQLARLKPEDIGEEETQFLRSLPLFYDARPQSRLFLVPATANDLCVLPAPPSHLHFPQLLAQLQWAQPMLHLQSPICSTLADLFGLRRLTMTDVLKRIADQVRSCESRFQAFLSWLLVHSNSLRQNCDCRLEDIVHDSEFFQYFRDFVMVRSGLENEKDEIVHNALVQLMEASEATEEWEGMSSVPAVLCDNGVFHLPYTVLVSIPYGRNVCPFLCKPHPALSQSFLNLCSVRARLSLQEKVAIIKQIWVEYRTDPLGEDVLSFALEVLEDISRSISSDTKLDELDVFLPDSNAVLRRNDELVYARNNQSPEREKKMGNWFSYEGALSLVHGSVYQEIATRLGVRSVRDVELADLSAADWGDQFGQEVDLVSRINRLLHQYHGEHDLVQEFLQNAEDAGATSVVVVVDERRHGSTDVFSEAWACLQGPALLFYNNSTFTEEDLTGIQRLGIGSKAEEAGKIGRFGAGFNCAYRFTDAPHFISDDDVLCIFDPLRCYIARHPRDLPGKRLNIGAQPRFRHTFKDSYAALNECGVELAGGTLFRLPLRRISSPIWSEIITPSALIASLVQAEDAIRPMLLFLNNVKQISARVISSSGKMSELWSISAKTEPLSDTQTSLEFSNQTALAVQHIRNHGNHGGIKVSKWAHRKRLRHSKDGGSVVEERWLIALRLGFRRHLDRDFSQLKLLPLGGVAFREEGPDSPVDGVFASLPLPLRTGLPLTLHAHFCLDEARKTPTPASLSIGFHWNEALKAEVILPAYMDMLEYLEGETTAAVNTFWSALPRLDRIHTDWRPFAQLFYHEAVAESAFKVPSLSISDGAVTWNSIDGLTYFPDDHELGTLLEAMGIRMVHVDPLLFAPVRDALLEAGASLISPATVAELLRVGDATPAPPGSCLPCLLSESAFAKCHPQPFTEKDPHRRSVSVVIRLLNYLAQRPPHLTVNDRWALSLFGLPLKVTQDGRLDVFDDSIVLAESRQVSSLFPSSAAQFLDPDLVEALGELQNRLVPGNFQRLSLNDLPRLLRYNLDKTYESKDNCCLPLANIQQPWLHGFWTLLLNLLAQLKLETDTSDLYLNRAKRALANLADFKLVPIRQGEDEEPDLAPVSLLRYVFCPGTDEEQVCRSLGVPVFIEDFVAGEKKLSLLPEWTLFRNLLASGFGSCIKALGHWNDRRTVDWDADYATRNILEYIRSHANRIDTILIPIITRFPIFKTVEGVYARLDSPFPVYVFAEADEVPEEGRQHWCQGVLFLSRIPIYDQLYLRLSIPTINLPKVVVSYIIPTLPAMPVSERVSQLAFIASLKQHPSFEKERPDALVDVLKNMAIISTNDKGRLYKVSSYHDHTIPIFQSCLSESEFLPEEFRDDRIPLEFWRSLGLCTVPSPSQLLDFASRLAGDSEWEDDRVEYDERIRCLLDSIKENALQGDSPADAYRDCLDEISRLPLLPRQRRKAKYRSLTLTPAHEDPADRIAIRGSVTTEHESLMWTTGPCLPSWLTDKDLLSVLGAATQPTVETVIEHCKHLFPPLWQAKLTNETAKGLNSPKNIQLLNSVVTDILTFFAEHLDDARDKLIQLIEVPLMPVEEGRRLAPPSMLVIRLPDFILHQRVSPFLYEVPLCYGQWLDVLRPAGIREAADAAIFARTMELFHQHSLDTSNPNVAEAIMLAQQDYKLHESNTLILKDKEVEREIQLDDCMWLHPDEELNRLKTFISQLGVHLRPQLLSEIIAEEVDGEKSVACKQQPCPSRQTLESLLQSEEFSKGLAQVFRHETGLSAEVKDEVLGRMSRTHVACYSTLASHLVHRQTGTAVSWQSEPRQALYSPESECLAIEHEAASSSEGRSRFIAALARALHAALPLASFDSALLLQQLLDSRRPSEARLAPELLPPLHADLAPGGPRVGDRLGPSFMQHLLLSSLHFYSPGELVGYLRPTSNNEEDMLVILARVSSIVERRPDDDPKAITQRYRLILEEKPHMTPRTVEATALDIFKFSKPGKPDQDSPVESDGEEETETEEDEADGVAWEEAEAGAIAEAKEQPATVTTASEWDSQLSASRSSLNSPSEEPHSSAHSDSDAKSGRQDSLLDSEEEAAKGLDSPRIPISKTPTATPRKKEAKTTGTELLLRPVQPKPKRRLPKPIQRVRTQAEKEADARSDKEIMESITAELAEAAKLPDLERKKLVRRLLLQWHPDKNKDRDTHAIFLHVKAEIGRMEEAQMGDDWYERWWAAWKNGGAFPKGKPPPQPHKEAPKPNFQKPQQREDQPPWNPDDAMAARYWQQALHDRVAAKKAHDDPESFGSEHVIYLCQQSVEKMLKAALLKTKGTADRYSNLRHLIGVLSRYGGASVALRECIDDMMYRCDIDLGRMRYPDYLSHPHIPHSHYSTTQRHIALEALNTIHEALRAKYNFAAP